MQSIRSRIFLKILEWKKKRTPEEQRIDYIDFNTSISGLREKVNKGAGFFGRLPKGFILDNKSVDDINCDFISPQSAPPNKIIMYFHGGGLVCGTAKAHRGIVAKIAGKANLKAVVFDYGLAPEKPFPNGLNDSLAVYKYLLKNYRPENIAFMGDSGGGNLCLATLVALKINGLEQPSCAVALSPWTDLTNSGESRKFNAENDKLCWKNSENVFSQYYCNGESPENPLISPLFADLTGLPPIRLYAGGHETMLSDSVSFAEKAKKSGVDIKLTVGEGLFHCYPACAPLFPEATKALEDIAEFITQQVKQE